MIFLGKVISLDDKDGAERIKVRIKNADIGISDENLPYAFPSLPKNIRVKPKVGEMVIIECVNDDPKLARFYRGPVISQYQMMQKDSYDMSAGKMLNNKGLPPYPNVSNIPTANGCYADGDEVAIYGRKNSDIILGNDDIRIRCGARLFDKLEKTKFAFNQGGDPALMKLKYHERTISAKKPHWNPDNGDFEPSENADAVNSTASIVAQEINLISTRGDSYVNVYDTKESISDDDMRAAIESLHPLPYGDVLVKLLHSLIRAFNNHTHKYSQMTPVPDETYNELNSWNLEDIISKNVRTN